MNTTNTPTPEMITESYLKAFEVCKLVLDRQFIDDPNQLDSIWPAVRDDFLEEIYNNIIEFWGELVRNKGQIDRRGPFYLCLIAAYHVLSLGLDAKYSVELYYMLVNESTIESEDDVNATLRTFLENYQRSSEKNE